MRGRTSWRELQTRHKDRKDHDSYPVYKCIWFLLFVASVHRPSCWFPLHPSPPEKKENPIAGHPPCKLPSRQFHTKSSKLKYGLTRHSLSARGRLYLRIRYRGCHGASSRCQAKTAPMSGFVFLLSSVWQQSIPQGQQFHTVTPGPDP